MGGRDRETELRAGQNSEGGTEGEREPSGGRDEADVVTQGGHNSVTVGEKTDIDSNSSVGKDPGGDGGFSSHVDHAVLPNVVDGGQGADGVGDIVGSVGKRRETGSENLEGTEELLGLGVVAGGLVVEVFDFLRVGVDILVQTVEGLLLESLEKSQRLVFQGSKTAVDRTVRLDTGLTDLAILLGVRDVLEVGGMGASGDEADVESMVPLERFLIHELAAEVDLEEEGAPEVDKEGDTERDTDDAADGQLRDAETGGALEDDVEDVDGDGDGKVERDGGETPLERIRVLQDDETGEEEDGSGDKTGDERGDQPRQDNGSDTRPLDSANAEAANTGTGDGTDDSVGGRDGKTAGGSKKDPGGGADEGADHGEHEQLGLIAEESDVNEAALDGVGSGGTHEEGAEELADRGNEDGLLEVKGAGTDSGTEGVTDVVGSDTVAVQEGKNHAEGKEEGVITGEHHFERECGG